MHLFEFICLGLFRLFRWQFTRTLAEVKDSLTSTKKSRHLACWGPETRVYSLPLKGLHLPVSLKGSLQYYCCRITNVKLLLSAKKIENNRKNKSWYKCWSQSTHYKHTVFGAASLNLKLGLHCMNEYLLEPGSGAWGPGSTLFVGYTEIY